LRRAASITAIFTDAPRAFISLRMVSRLKPSCATSGSAQICASTGSRKVCRADWMPKPSKNSIATPPFWILA
jgi:hypothetical protein